MPVAHAFRWPDGLVVHWNSYVRRLAVAAAAAVLALAVSGAVPGVGDALAYLLPPLLLLLALLARRYPGERALLRLIAAERPERTRNDAGRGVPGPRPRGMVPRGGCLIASSLAVRPPPAPSAAPS
jgi:hypothetical protein